MRQRKSAHRMNDERFQLWFEQFKIPYKQTSFIHSYKSLENPYSELVIKYLLSPKQQLIVQKFIHDLPKMNSRRFDFFMKKFKTDPTLLYKYSYKDFTKKQQYLINFHLVKHYLTHHLFKSNG